jgi:hypothetical protein
MLFDLRAQCSSRGSCLAWMERARRRARARCAISSAAVLRAGDRHPRLIVRRRPRYSAAANIPEIGAVAADSPFADIRDMMEQELRAKLGFGKPSVPASFSSAVSFFGWTWVR